jgi:outer membrane protein assembly factor BamB
MRAYPFLRRWLALGGTLAVFAGIVFVNVRSSRTSVAADNPSERPWPMFGGTVQRNMINPVEKNIADDWDINTKSHVKWVAELGSKAYGGPIIAGGRVFVGTNNDKPRNPKILGDKGVLMCFDENSGRFLWQAVHDKLPAGRVNDWPHEGICSSPFVEGNRLYYVDNRAEIVCTDPAGDPATQSAKKPVWVLDMIAKEGVFPHNLATSSPLIVGDTLFVVTSNGVDEGHINIPKPQAPSFLAVDKRDGHVIWRNNAPSERLAKAGGTPNAVAIKELVNRGELLMHGQWSSPVYAEVNGQPQIVFPGGDGWMRAFEPATGKLIWQFDCNPKNSKYDLGGKGTRSDFVSTPIVYENKVYIGVGQDPEHEEGVGHLWCIDMTKKGDISPDLLDETTNPPTIKKNPNSGAVWTLGGPAKPGSGRRFEFGRTLSTCAGHDGRLYAADLSGWLYCLDAKTGKKHWEHNMEAACWCSPYVVDGKVYMGNDDGKIFIFKDSTTKQKVREIEMEEKVRATPVAANGVLYVMTETKLYAIK